MTNIAGRAGRQVTTTSQVHAWWLVAFRGYRVTMKTVVPQQGLLGRVRYATTWLLKGPDG